MKYLLKGRKKPPKGQEEETWHTCPRTYYPAPESERWTYNKRLWKETVYMFLEERFNNSSM